MYRLLLIILFTGFLGSAEGQVRTTAPVEDSVYAMFVRFSTMQDAGALKLHNERIIDYMKDVFSRPGSFELRFDSLRKRAGILKPPDNSFRIITWNVPLNAWEHEYFGIIQVPLRGSDSCMVHVLVNRLGDIREPEHARTDAGIWPGALYYDIIQRRHGREMFYTLIGYNFNDRWSDKKIIEAIDFDEDMKPVFGRPIFNTPAGVQHRVIFEYSGEVAMNLRYNPDLKMIVYDHLAPIEPELKAFPRFYAPDFTYDGYRFRRGMWLHQSEVDVRNK